MGATKWFEWNKLDLSQFDSSLILGPNVTGSGFTVETDGNIKWIEITATANAHAGGALSQAVLLITQAPPPDAILVADIISVQEVAANIFGGGVVIRYTAVNAGYWGRFSDQSIGPQVWEKLGGTVGAPTASQIGKVQSDPTLDVGVKNGGRLGIGVEGESWVRAMMGEEQIIPDLSTPHTATGQAGLFVTCSSTAATCTVRFKNICGYYV
jgi:hypothetical protein